MLPVLFGLAALALFADEEEGISNERLDKGNSRVNTGDTDNTGDIEPPVKPKPALKRKKSHELQVNPENGSDRSGRGSGGEPGGSTSNPD